MQERILSAAASTSTLLKRSISETKEKVATGKVIVGEAAKKTAQKSKSILTNIERWQKGVASNDVFGVPIEIVVQRQNTSRPIPEILIKCADYIVLSGLTSEYIFKSEGDGRVVQDLISLYNEDWKAPLPEGVSPIDVADLLKIYLISLPEPIISFDLYDEIKDARSNVQQLRNILKKLSSVNHSTLEFITALLLRVSQKSALNKMDAHGLAVELAPTIFWQRNERKSNISGQQLPLWHAGTLFRLRSPSQDSEGSLSRTWTGRHGFSTKNGNNTNAISDFDDLRDLYEDGNSSSGGLDVASQIPLDDGIPPVDYVIVEVVQCLIERHNAVFTDASETVWH